MSQDSISIGFRRIVPACFGVLLMASIFLPWFSVTSWGVNVSVSGSGFSESLGWIGFIGGVAAVGAIFVEEKKIRGTVYLLVGTLSLLIFFHIISSYPKISFGEELGLNKRESLEIMDILLEIAVIGFYLYFVSIAGLIISGLVELLAPE